MDEPLVQSFGRYKVLKVLGAGGMGEVLLARDELLAREVAIKTVRVLGLDSNAGELFRARFLNEARAIAALSHPNVVRVFDLGFEGDTPYLVMEVVAGPSLSDRLERGACLSEGEARALAVQIGRALEAAHARGIVHRDVKPANVLEAEPGLWKLADFGVARVPDSSLTLAGQFLGSPAYAPPEALSAACFSPATDVYGLGATLFAGLAGEPPRRDPQRGGKAAPITEHCPDLAADLARAIEWALSPNPLERPSAAALVAALTGPTPARGALPCPARVAVPGAAARSATLASAETAALPASATVLTGPGGRPPARRDPSARARLLWLAGCLTVLAVLIGLVVGLTLSSRSWRQVRSAARPAPDAAAEARPVVGPGPVSAQRASDEDPRRNKGQRKKWRKIQEKLAKGKLHEAERELERYLHKFPYDSEAAELYHYLRSQPRWEVVPEGDGYDD